MNGRIDSAKILIVDDTPANLQLLSNILSEEGYTVRMAPSGKLALMNVKISAPDLILADIKMPEMDGFELCEKLKSDPAAKEIPVIFISALDQTEDKVRAFTIGGVDYITKPFQVEEVLARVKTHLSLYFLQRQLEILATTDPLTGLANRRSFFELARREFSRAQRYSHNISLMIIDLDNFKQINDTFGHAFGDEVLKSVAACLQENSRDVDITGRFGGDEFVILIPESTPVNAHVLAERIAGKLPDQINGKAHPGTLSVGIAHYGEPDEFDFDALFDQADNALYKAKECGRNCVRVWGQDF